MARTTGRGNSKKLSLPASVEMLNIVGKSVQLNGTEFSGPQTSVSKIRLTDTEDIFRDSSQSLDFYDPKKYNVLTGYSENVNDRLTQQEDTLLSRQFYEIIPLEGGFVPGFEPDETEDHSAAPLTIIPTSTTNPERPRTVAAGYDEDQEKLTVMFRDGTLYNYYEVDANEWKAFKSNRSKGAVIYRMLDFKPRGYADDSSMSEKARKAFYRFSRGSQIYSQGKEKGQTKAAYKTQAQYTKVKGQGKNPSKGGTNSYKKR